MCNCATISAQFLQPHVVAYSSAKLNVTGNTIPDCISGYEVCFSQRVSEKKKKNVEFACEVWKHNEDLQIFKDSVCTGLEECSSAGQADRHTSQKK